MPNIFRVQLLLQYDSVVITNFILSSFFIFLLLLLLLHFHKQSNKNTGYSDRRTHPSTPIYTTRVRKHQCEQTQNIIVSNTHTHSVLQTDVFRAQGGWSGSMEGTGLAGQARDPLKAECHVNMYKNLIQPEIFVECWHGPSTVVTSNRYSTSPLSAFSRRATYTNMRCVVGAGAAQTWECGPRGPWYGEGGKCTVVKHTHCSALLSPAPAKSDTALRCFIHWFVIEQNKFQLCEFLLFLKF